MSRLPVRRVASVLGALLVAAALALAGCGGGSTSGGDTSASGDTSAGTDTSASETPGGDGARTEVPAELEAAIEKAAASGVPVRIPPALLESPPPGAGHAEVLRSPADSYTLGLAAQPRCRFESSCIVAIFSGSAGGGKPSGRPLDLAAGIEGSYEPGRCGPGCKFGTVAWRQDGDTYGAGVPNASVEELVVLADEAITAEPVAEGRK